MSIKNNNFDDLRKKYSIKYSSETVDSVDLETISTYNDDNIRKEIAIIEKDLNKKKDYLNQLKENIDQGIDNSEKIKNSVNQESENIKINLAKLEAVSKNVGEIIDEIEKNELEIVKNTQELKEIMNSKEAKETIDNIKSIKERIKSLKIFLE